MEETPEISDAISRFLQGNISEKEIKGLTKWINQNEENKKLFFEIKTIYELRKGGAMPTEAEMEQSWVSLEQRINEQDQEKSEPDLFKKPVKRAGFKTFFNYAAVAAVFIGMTLGIHYFFSQNQEPHYNVFEIQAGSKSASITLSDGTKVVLNAATTLKYPDRFSSSVREVFLDGEAFFDVVKNDQSPFTVRTDQQRISVLGTSFNVMAYSEDHYTITTLMSGSILLETWNETGSILDKVIIKPNQQAYVNKADGMINVSFMANVSTANSWINRTFHFKDEAMAFISERLEKLYGVSIHIPDDELKKIKYTGTFSLDQEITEVLEIINFKKQFLYTIHQNEITIEKGRMFNPQKK